jgi:pimeloyl-ACP methyl ester carboxylesterase
MGKYVNGIAVHTYGDKDKTPIIFIHGFPYNSSMWSQQIKQLKEHYYCVAYDVRGLGDTPPGDGQFTMEMFVDDLFTVIEGLELYRPVVAGFSMGGYIALRAMEREPERFRALILCDTRAEADDGAGRLKRSNAVRLINEEGVESFAADFVPMAFSADAPQRIPDIYNEFLEKAQAESPIGVKGCLLAMAIRTDTSHVLDTIQIPTLLVVGAKDTITPPEVMQQMQAKIKDAEMIIVPEAAHMSPLENPEVVTQGIMDFLAKSI